MNPKFAAYATPDILVDTDWLAANLETSGIRIVESNEDLLLYDMKHIPGAVHIDWRRDLNDQTTRDYVGPEEFAELCKRNGITPETTVIFYGDKSNWWACYAFWVFQLFGHTKAKILDGGRDKWEEEGRQLTRAVTTYQPTDYPVPTKRDDVAHRAYFQQTLEHYQAGKKMVDVRSPKEYSGEVTHMPEYPQEGVLRGGHIPGAQSCPWARAANPDKTFKTRTELEAIYGGELGLKTDDDIIAYCRIGERSSHTWFVLKYLLGYTHVRNYDGSWTEWGNMVRTPIEKGA
ncbi:MAG: sulfurtransferase [Prosthecobacter sp.]|nr:sulfurtransferase [Prosthecobacter sp.]